MPAVVLAKAGCGASVARTVRNREVESSILSTPTRVLVYSEITMNSLEESEIEKRDVGEWMVEFSNRIAGRRLQDLFIASPHYRDNIRVANEAHSLLKAYLKEKYVDLDDYINGTHDYLIKDNPNLKHSSPPSDEKLLGLYIATTRKIKELGKTKSGFIATFANAYFYLQGDPDIKHREVFERMFMWTVRLADGQRIRRDRADYYDKLPKRQR